MPLSAFAGLECFYPVQAKRDYDIADTSIERWVKQQFPSVLYRCGVGPKRSLILRLTNSKRLL